MDGIRCLPSLWRAAAWPCLCLALFLSPLLALADATPTPLRLGVLAFRPKPDVIQKWQPLADYLNAQGLKQRFVLEALTYQELEEAVQRRQIDIVLTQPAHYVQLTYLVGLHSPLATLVEKEGEQHLERFGGAILRLTERSDLRELADIKGKRVAITQKSSLGGYLVQAYELQQAGITPQRDVTWLEFPGPQDKAVNAVLNGEADVAFVRTGVLEAMSRKGLIDPGRLSLIKAPNLPDFPLGLSTRLYPEWAITTLPWVDDTMSRGIAKALFSLDEHNPHALAAGIAGFTIPGNYRVVDDMMRALKAPPFDKESPLQSFWKTYRDAITLTVAALLILIFGLLTKVWHGHRQLRLKHAAISSSTELQKAILDSLGEGVFGVDLEGKLTFMNPAAIALLGYPPAEAIGRSSHPLFHHHRPDGSEYPSSACPIHQTLRDGCTRQMEEWFWRREPDSGFPVLLTVTPTRRGDEIIGAVAVFQDIEERKKAELELAAYRLGLEKKVAERTDDLKVAKEAAEVANRAKTAFLSMASHELRTPMNGIMGMINLAMRQSDNPQLREHLGKADRASRQLLGIINDVLDISRIESNRMNLAFTAFTLGELRRNVLDATGELAAQKALSFTFDLPPDAANLVLIGDPTRLGQILINLVGNAIKFTASGQVSVDVTHREASEGKRSHLRFEVRDTGIGIHAEDQERIFQPFEQVDASESRRFGGTGLGLSLCKRLLEAMNGEIGVHSAPGKGSCFWFALELAHDENREASIEEEGSLLDALRKRHGGANVLLVEDEPLNQEIGCAMLEEAGLSVFLAGDGMQAVEAARVAGFDLILMDMNMPQLSGIEATYRIREIPVHATTPIIAMTANAFAEDRSACIQAGMNDHIGKPVTPDVLYRTVLRWLDKHCAARSQH